MSILEMRSRYRKVVKKGDPPVKKILVFRKSPFVPHLVQLLPVCGVHVCRPHREAQWLPLGAFVISAFRFHSNWSIPFVSFVSISFIGIPSNSSRYLSLSACRAATL